MNTASKSSLFFYQDEKLLTVKQGDQHRAIFRHAQSPLAELSIDASHTTCLLITDDKGSVLSVLAADEEETHTYSAYGHNPQVPSLRTLLGFNGEETISVPGRYALGNGYRSFSPAQMRFLSPDNVSPFGEGGLNAYCYCACDPINNTDPSGHLSPTSWRSPTTRQWRPIRQRELEGPRLGATEIASHHRRRRATEILANSIRQDEFREDQRSLAPGRGNLHMPSHPSLANPNPERQSAVATPGSTHGRSAAQPDRAEMLRTSHPDQNTHAFGRPAPASPVSSTSSEDSWDEWRPNPVLVERQRNQAISIAIRVIRRGT